MLFHVTPLPGAFLLEMERFEDERGFFACAWNAMEFAAGGKSALFVQSNVAFNIQRGTLRGMHYQAAPHAEIKLIRCTMGAIYDVIIDLRPESPTFLRWYGHELSAANLTQLYIPEGFAHGYQTLKENTEVCYQVSEYYHPEAARGVRWDDPAFGIAWPLPVSKIIKRDANYPDFGT